MTNQELILLFNEVDDATSNIFDAYEKLSEYATDYLNMNISKIIPSIYDAYDKYQKSQGSIDKVVNAILNADYSKIIDTFDLTNLFKQIPEEYQGTFAKLLDESSKK